MNYCIFSIDDSRKAYTDAIRAKLGESFWWNEVKTHCIDGRKEDVNRWLDWYGLTLRKDDLKVGQLGIWFTVLNALHDFSWEEPFVTFEDDAILNSQFLSQFWITTNNLPKDTDVFALFLPRDQDSVYSNHASELHVAQGICRAYQRYGGVSMLWTPDGADRFMKLVIRDGITGQWDDQLFQYAKSGEMKVYTQPPPQHSQTLVYISGIEPSLVQESKYAR